MASSQDPPQDDHDYDLISEYDHEDQDNADSLNEPPLHPIPSMQAAFEESIADAADGDDHDEREQLHTLPNPEARRRELLDQPSYDDSLSARWRLKPTAINHPLVKLMAQIIFGLHLLHQQQAKSDAEVVKILQTHVDEIDGFLERTTEDFDAAIKDIKERIGFLKLPMTHLEVFDVMLDDRKFRNQLIEGNDKIERIIDRSAKAMNAALFDVDHGLTSARQLADYLDRVQLSWPQNSSEQAAILVAMRGNQEGWSACLSDLRMKADTLREALVQLGTVIGEMSKLAAAASRRNHVKLRSAQSPPHDRLESPRPSPTSYNAIGIMSSRSHRRKPSVAEANKPLPNEPDSYRAAVRATVSRSVDSTRGSQDERWPPTPDPQNNNGFQSPRLAMEPREARSPDKSQTSDLAGFLKFSSPRNPNAPHEFPARSASDPQHSKYKQAPSQNHPAGHRLKNTDQHHRNPSEQAPEFLDMARRMSHDAASRGAAVDYHYQLQHQSDDAQHQHQHQQQQLTPESNKDGFPADSPRLGLFPEPVFTASPPRSSPTGSIHILSPTGLSSPGTRDYWPQVDIGQEKTQAFSIKKLFSRKKEPALYI